MDTPRIERKVIDGIHLPPLTVKSAVVTAALTLHYRFEHSGWAIFTVDPETCILNIQSDWGNYAYRWPKGGCGDTPFLEWLARTCKRDPHYVTSKLAYDSDELKDEIDEKKTLASVRKAIGEAGVDPETAEEWRESLEDWCLGSEEEMYATAPDWAYDHFGVDLPIMHRPSARWSILQHALLPFFGEKLAAHLGKAAA